MLEIARKFQPHGQTRNGCLNNALFFCPSIHIAHCVMSASEAHSHDDFRHVLDRLKLLLENLPRSLPEKSLQELRFACFLNFSLDPDILEKTGCEVAALSEHLKAVFGWQARTTGDDIVPFTRTW